MLDVAAILCSALCCSLLCSSIPNRLRDSVATVDTEIGTSHVASGVTGQERDGAHEVLGTTHLALGNKAGPLVGELGVVIEDLLGAVRELLILSFFPFFPLFYLYSQCSQHVTGRDAVDADAGVGPFNCQRAGQMTDGSLGRVVGCLRLGNVDNRTGHAANEDHAAWSLALHQVASNGGREKVGTVNVDTPQFLDTVIWVGDGVVVLGEASRGHQVVNAAVVADNSCNGGVD